MCLGIRANIEFVVDRSGGRVEGYIPVVNITFRFFFKAT